MATNISGNKIHNCEIGISTPAGSDVNIQANEFLNCITAIDLKTSKNVDKEGNLINKDHLLVLELTKLRAQVCEEKVKYIDDLLVELKKPKSSFTNVKRYAVTLSDKLAETMLIQTIMNLVIRLLMG